MFAPQVTERRDYTEGISYIPQDAVVGVNGEADSEYRLDRVVGRYVLSVSGLGLPPIDYPSQRGPFQHGTTVLDYFLEPRVLQLALRQRLPDRGSWWGNAIPNPASAVSAPPYGQGRGGLLNALRPNRAPTAAISNWRPGRLRFYRSPLPSRPFAGQSTIDLSGKLQPEMLDIDVLVTEALSGITPQPGVWDSHGFTDIVRFLAPDPVLYWPVQQSEDMLSGVTGAWGPTSIDLDYFGTWADYPIITVDDTGGGAVSLSSLLLEMLRNGGVEQTVDLTATTGTANYEVFTFDFRYGYKLVYATRAGFPDINLMPYLSADSDMATFRLEPYPVAASGGVNTLRITATGVTPTTRIRINWMCRYIGI